MKNSKIVEGTRTHYFRSNLGCWIRKVNKKLDSLFDEEFNYQVKG